VLECLDWYAAILHVEQDPTALPTAREALRLASELRPAPTRTLVRLWGHIGAIAVSQHKWQEAITAYQTAVEVGGDLLDLSRAAKMYNDLSVAYRRTNQLAEARRYALRAVEVHKMLNDQLSVARAETNLALILLRDSRHSDAEKRLDRALKIFRDSNQEHGRSYIHLALAEVALARGRLVEAEAQTDQALSLAQALTERASLAEAHELLGRIAAARKDWSRCDQEFTAAIGVLDDLAIPERLARIHAVYANVLEKSGKAADARLHWRKAVEAEHPDLVHELEEPGLYAPPVSARIQRSSKSA